MKNDVDLNPVHLSRLFSYVDHSQGGQVVASLLESLDDLAD
jgi:hypothetical protein